MVRTDEVAAETPGWWDGRAEGGRPRTAATLSLKRRGRGTRGTSHPAGSDTPQALRRYLRIRGEPLTEKNGWLAVAEPLGHSRTDGRIGARECKRVVLQPSTSKNTLEIQGVLYRLCIWFSL